MLDLDELKRDLEKAAIAAAASKKSLLQAMGLPTSAKLKIERYPAATKLVIEVPRR